MAYNRLEISGVTIYGNVFQPKSYGVKRKIDCMLSEPSTFEVQDATLWERKCALCIPREVASKRPCGRCCGDESKHKQLAIEVLETVATSMD